MCVGLFLPVSRRRRLWGKCTHALWPNSVHSSWPRDISLLLNALFYTSNSFVPVLRRHSTALPLPLSVLTSQISLFFSLKNTSSYFISVLRRHSTTLSLLLYVLIRYNLTVLLVLSHENFWPSHVSFFFEKCWCTIIWKPVSDAPFAWIHCHWRSASPRLCHRWKLS